MLTIDRDMVLVAECRNGQIDMLPILWYAPLLDRLLLVRGVTLLGSGDNGGVDDLSTHSKIAQRSQRLVEAKKQSVDDFGLLQGFPEGPDRIGVGNRIGEPQSQKPHEGQPILNQIFAALVGESVHGLQDQYFEHQHMIKRRTTAPRSIGAGNRCFEIGSELPEINEAFALQI